MLCNCKYCRYYIIFCRPCFFSLLFYIQKLVFALQWRFSCVWIWHNNENSNVLLWVTSKYIWVIWTHIPVTSMISHAPKIKSMSMLLVSDSNYKTYFGYSIETVIHYYQFYLSLQLSICINTTSSHVYHDIENQCSASQ